MPILRLEGLSPVIPSVSEDLLSVVGGEPLSTEAPNDIALTHSDFGPLVAP